MSGDLGCGELGIWGSGEPGIRGVGDPGNWGPVNPGIRRIGDRDVGGHQAGMQAYAEFMVEGVFEWVWTRRNIGLHRGAEVRLKICERYEPTPLLAIALSDKVLESQSTFQMKFHEALPTAVGVLSPSRICCGIGGIRRMSGHPRLGQLVLAPLDPIWAQAHLQAS